MSESTSFNVGNVSVLFYYDGNAQYAHPVRLFWDAKEHELGGVQFWYSENKKKKLVHHYTVGDKRGDYTFYLTLETENLTWTLDKVESLAPKQDTGSLRGALAGFQIRGLYA